MKAHERHLRSAHKHRKVDEVRALVAESFEIVKREVRQSVAKNSNTLPQRFQRKLTEFFALFVDILKYYKAEVDLSSSFTQIVELVAEILGLECEQPLRLLVWDIFCRSITRGISDDDFAFAVEITGCVLSDQHSIEELNVLSLALTPVTVEQASVWIKLFANVILPFFAAYPLTTEFKWKQKTKYISMNIVEPLIRVFEKLADLETPVNLMSIDDHNLIFASIVMLSAMGESGGRNGETAARVIERCFDVSVYPRPGCEGSSDMMDLKLEMSSEEKEKWRCILTFLNSVSCDWTVKFLLEVFRASLCAKDPIKLALVFRKLCKMGSQAGNGKEMMNQMACVVLSLLSRKTAVPVLLGFLTLMFDMRTPNELNFNVFAGTRSGISVFDGILKMFLGQLVCVFSPFYFSDLSADDYKCLREMPVRFNADHRFLCFLDTDTIAVESQAKCRYSALSARKWNMQEAENFIFGFAKLAETTGEITFYYAFAESLIGLALHVREKPTDNFVHVCQTLLAQILNMALQADKYWSARLVRNIDGLMNFIDVESDYVGQIGHLFLSMAWADSMDKEGMHSVFSAITSHECLFGLMKPLMNQVNKKSEVLDSFWLLQFLVSVSLVGDEPAAPALRECLESEIKSLEPVRADSLVFSLVLRLDSHLSDPRQLLLVYTMLTLNGIYENNAYSSEVAEFWNNFTDTHLETVTYESLTPLSILFREADVVQQYSEEPIAPLLAKILTVVHKHTDNPLYVKTFVLMVRDVVTRVSKFYSRFFRMCNKLMNTITDKQLQEWVKQVATKVFLGFGTDSNHEMLQRCDLAMRLNYCNYFIENVSEDCLILQTEHFGQKFDCTITERRRKFENVQPIESPPTCEDQESVCAPPVFERTKAKPAKPEDFEFPTCPECNERVSEVTRCDSHVPTSDSLVTFLSIIAGDSLEMNVLGQGSQRGEEDRPTLVVNSLIYGEEGVFPHMEELLLAKWQVRSQRVERSFLDSPTGILLLWNGTEQETVYQWAFQTIPLVELTPLKMNPNIIRMRCLNPRLPLLTGVLLSRMETLCNVIGYFVSSQAAPGCE